MLLNIFKDTFAHSLTCRGQKSLDPYEYVKHTIQIIDNTTQEESLTFATFD